MSDILSTMLRYQAWADGELFAKLALVDPVRFSGPRQAALRLLDHCHVVAEIFAAHLEGRSHDFTSDQSPVLPDINALAKAVEERNRWYATYLETTSQSVLRERVSFVFTDGDAGCMSRVEMLTHVVLHGGYHRAEAGRILAQIDADLPWDTFAVFLHASEPWRRQTGRPQAAGSLETAGMVP